MAADRAKLCIERYWEVLVGLLIGTTPDLVILPDSPVWGSPKLIYLFWPYEVLFIYFFTRVDSLDTDADLHCSSCHSGSRCRNRPRHFLHVSFVYIGNSTPIGCFFLVHLVKFDRLRLRSTGGREKSNFTHRYI